MVADSNEVAVELLAKLDRALCDRDIDRAVDLFAEQSYWRDLVALTWNVKTMEGKGAISDMLLNCLELTAPRNWQVTGAEGLLQSDDAYLAWISFETLSSRGSGLLRIQDGKISRILTVATELKGYEEQQGRTRNPGLDQGAVSNRKTWGEKIADESTVLGRSEQPYVVIVGGGQGGIALAARLRQLRVPTVVLDRHEHPGDQWRKRYSTLTLQDPVWYDHLPYLEFPKNWPVYTPKDKIADWLGSYSSIMDLNFWGNTEVTDAEYDEVDGSWQVHAIRDGEEVTINPQHLVFATGMSGRPHIPTFSGMKTFDGDQHHSSLHPGPHEYSGKRAVVLGSNNSAHDIAQALWEVGAEVTIVQRSSTLVVKQSTLHKHHVSKLYSEDALERGLTVERADMVNAATPYALLAESQRPTNEAIKADDKEFYEALAEVGFKVNWGEDGNTGVFTNYLTRGAGYYIEIGASQLVIDGEICLKSGVDVAEVTPRSVRFSDGSETPADLIVYATGYEPMEGCVQELLGDEVAEKVGRVWGLGTGLRGDPGPWEGELRNMWKPTAQSGLWFQGGNLSQARFYSRTLALQLKARYEEVPVYAFP